LRPRRCCCFEAHGDQIGLLNADPLVRRVALGDTDDQLIDYIRTDPDGQKWFRDQQDYHINGRSVWDESANNGNVAVGLAKFQLI
jgi:hypothetical protein